MTMDLISMLQEAAASATDVAKASNLNGSFTLGVAGAGAGIGIGLTGFAAAQAVGRNPGAFGNILVIANSMVDTLAGQPTKPGYAEGAASAAQFNGPSAVAVDPLQVR
jgi:F-type H+-transporting ATPase subunit c